MQGLSTKLWGKFLPLSYIQAIHSFATWKYHCLKANDISRSHSIIMASSTYTYIVAAFSSYHKCIILSIVAACSCPNTLLPAMTSNYNYTTSQVTCDDNSTTKDVFTMLTVVVVILTVALIVAIIAIILLTRRNFKQLQLQWVIHSYISSRYASCTQAHIHH